MEIDTTQEFFTTSEVSKMIGASEHAVRTLTDKLALECHIYNHTKLLYTKEQMGVLRVTYKASEYLNKRGMREFIKNNLELAVGGKYISFVPAAKSTTSKVYEWDVEKKLSVIS